MGCFNKSCVITGLQITHNDPIVGIKLKKSEHAHRYKHDVDFDHIGSEWYPIEFPIRGVYDDYGRIEVDGKLYEGNEDEDYDSTRCDDYMFVHEWAYDYICEYHASKKVPDYVAKWEKEDQNSLKEAFDLLSEHKDQNNPTSRSMYFVAEMTIRANSERWLQMYFAVENKNYWFDKLFTEDYETFTANLKRFKDELGILETYRFELGFQWHPSYIANQEVDHDLRLGLIERSEKYLRADMKQYAEEEY